MRSLVLVAVLAALPGCPGRGRPTLEPEGTVTRTWVGEEGANVSSLPEAPALAPPETTTAPTSDDGDAAPAAGERQPPPSPAGAPSGRRGWVKGGSWDR